MKTEIPPMQWSKTVPLFLKKVRANKGQALIELALVVIIFTLMSVGILDFGRAMLRMHQLASVAREGVRLASLTNALDSAASQLNVRNRIETLLEDMAIDVATVNIQISPIDSNNDGSLDLVDITLSQPYSDAIGVSIIPGLSNMVLSVTMSMPVFITG